MSNVKSNKLIFCAYAYDEKLKSGANVSRLSQKQKFDMYMKNVFVALASAKYYNANCDVALVTNVDMPKQIARIFADKNIMIYKKEFDCFNFGENYKWSLAFYKLNAIKYVLSKGYDKYLLIDTDVYVQSSLEDLWVETEYNLMLYDINHRLDINNCKLFNDEVKEYTGIIRPITNYGGEFIAGKKIMLEEFIGICEDIFFDMKKKNFRTDRGDEFITRLAADKMRMKVKNAGGYVYRFWTGSFRLVSSCYKYNAVSVLHVPDEKMRGMIKLYDYIHRKNQMPKPKMVYKILHLTHPTLKNKIILLRDDICK